MDQAIPKDMRGAMYSTHEHKTSRKQPDYTGRVNIGGRIFRIAGWYEPPTEGRRIPRIAIALEGEEAFKARQQGRTGHNMPADPWAKAPGRRQEDAFADDIPF